MPITPTNLQRSMRVNGNPFKIFIPSTVSPCLASVMGWGGLELPPATVQDPLRFPPSVVCPCSPCCARAALGRCPRSCAVPLPSPGFRLRASRLLHRRGVGSSKPYTSPYGRWNEYLKWMFKKVQLFFHICKRNWHHQALGAFSSTDESVFLISTSTFFE